MLCSKCGKDAGPTTKTKLCPDCAATQYALQRFLHEAPRRAIVILIVALVVLALTGLATYLLGK